MPTDREKRQLIHRALAELPLDDAERELLETGVSTAAGDDLDRLSDLAVRMLDARVEPPPLTDAPPAEAPRAGSGASGFKPPVVRVRKKSGVTKAYRVRTLKGLKYSLRKGDTGTTRMQIAVLNGRIVHLTEHLKRFPTDQAARVGLLRLVGRRAALLRYYSKKNPQAYRDLIKELGIRS